MYIGKWNSYNGVCLYCRKSSNSRLCINGVNAVILPDIKIGKGAIIGAGAVFKDVKAFDVVVGNPARFLKKIKRHIISTFCEN